MQKSHHSWNLSFHLPFGQDHLWLTSHLYSIACAIRYQKKYFRKIKIRVVEIWSQQQYFSLIHSSWQILDNHGEPWRISIYKIRYIYIHMHTHTVGPILPIVTLVEKSVVLQVWNGECSACLATPAETRYACAEITVWALSQHKIKALLKRPNPTLMQVGFFFPCVSYSCVWKPDVIYSNEICIWYQIELLIEGKAEGHACDVRNRIQSGKI